MIGTFEKQIYTESFFGCHGSEATLEREVFR